LAKQIKNKKKQLRGAYLTSYLNDIINEYSIIDLNTHKEFKNIQQEFISVIDVKKKYHSILFLKKT
jgi:D-ribose pyranose/furanose isomerase RbsD